MKKMHQQLLRLTLSAMFLALCLVLPFLTGQIPRIGNMLLPMHVPVLLCGLICGWHYGLVVGAAAPLLRFAMFGAPPMPNAISMAFELATYGLVIGLVYMLLRKKNILTLYVSMLIAMVAGRAVWGVAQSIVMGINEKSFTCKIFIAGAFTNAIPGIILQLILIPAIMVALDRLGVVRFSKKIS